MFQFLRNILRLGSKICLNIFLLNFQFLETFCLSPIYAREKRKDCGTGYLGDQRLLWCGAIPRNIVFRDGTCVYKWL